MKRSLFLMILCLFIVQLTYGQTATNFDCNDCSGQNYNLFSELDDGKVIVLCWVMPCGPCQGPALTSFNVVNSFAESHPNRVKLYLVDDYGDTNCGPLVNWVNDKGMSKSTVFSDATIDMSDYGAFGMPKIAVVGGTDHQIFFQAEFSVDGNLLHAAITDALLTSPIIELKSTENPFIIYPNPAVSEVTIEFALSQASEVQIHVVNLQGQRVLTQHIGEIKAGDQSINLNTTKLKPGNYTIYIKADNFNKSAKLEILH